jgi:peptidoglycan pentaglycine glycine transferase (the first glycine)
MFTDTSTAAVKDEVTAVYQLRTVSEIERTEWNRFVAEQSNGHVLQSWEWGELKAGAQWRTARLAMWHDGKIVGAAQVLQKTLPHFPHRLGYLAYIPKGPVIDWSREELCRLFFIQLGSYLRREGALAVRIEPDVEQGSDEGTRVVRLLQELRMYMVGAVQPRRSILLDLTPDESMLLAQMKEKWRYNVRLGVRKGVTVRSAQTEEDVRAWYKLYEVTSERDRFGIHPLEYYLRAWKLFAADDTARLLLAESEGRLLAGIFVSVFGRQGIYLYGASSNELRQLMPNYVLQWEAIRWCKACGATVYDFWGIPETEDEDEAMAGVYRFKRGWGGRVVEFVGCYEYAYHGWLMKIASRFIR